LRKSGGFGLTCIHYDQPEGAAPRANAIGTDEALRAAGLGKAHTRLRARQKGVRQCAQKQNRSARIKL
jgi:hypothetical protein